MAVGEDAEQNAATLDDAVAYKAGQNYPDDLPTVLDGKFIKLQETIKHGSLTAGIGLPYFVVLGPLMEILYVGSDQDAVESFMTEAIAY